LILTFRSILIQRMADNDLLYAKNATTRRLSNTRRER